AFSFPFPHPGKFTVRMLYAEKGSGVATIDATVNVAVPICETQVGGISVKAADPSHGCLKEGVEKSLVTPAGQSMVIDGLIVSADKARVQMFPSGLVTSVLSDGKTAALHVDLANGNHLSEVAGGAFQVPFDLPLGPIQAKGILEYSPKDPNIILHGGGDLSIFGYPLHAPDSFVEGAANPPTDGSGFGIARTGGLAYVGASTTFSPP